MPDRFRQHQLPGIARGRRPRIRETVIAKDCEAELNRRGYAVYRIQCGLWFPYKGTHPYSGAPAGTPDYVAIHGERLSFLLETKASDGQLEPSQKFQHQVIQQSYRLAICIVRDVWSLIEWVDRFEAQQRSVMSG